MSAKKESATIVGLGVAACVACCAGPILGVLAAIGLGSAAGFTLFGAVAILIGAAIAAFVVMRRRRRGVVCATGKASEAVTVEFSSSRGAP